MDDLNLTAVFEPCEEGGYMAYIKEIPGINSQGETMDDSKENLTDAINIFFEESVDLR
jgi:predicted RNase H-like HicB family nuclease